MDDLLAEMEENLLANLTTNEGQQITARENDTKIFNAGWGLIDGLDIEKALLDKLNCIEISQAILAQGIDDFTSYTPVQLGTGLAYGLLMLFGLFSNGSVLLAFVRNRRLRSSRNFFLLNLIMTDILLCLTAIPITPWYAMTKDWTFGAVLCRFVPLCNSCAVFVTSWSLTAIAFDKYMHIVVEPTRRHFSRQLAGFVTFCIWIGSMIVNIPYLMSFELVDGFYVVAEDHFTRFCGKFCDEFNWASETQRRIYGVIVLLFQFVIPMAVITFCHLRILHKVQMDMIVQNAQFRKTLTSSQRTDAINRKRRVNYTLLGMVLAFVGCNVPLTSVNLVKDFGREPEFLLKQPYLCPLIAHFIAMTIVCWNPLLFFWLSAKDKSRGSSANGQLMSVGGSDPHQQGTVQNLTSNCLTVSNLLRRWSRTGSEFPSTSFLHLNGVGGGRKETIVATRSQQMLHGNSQNGSLRGTRERRPNQLGSVLWSNQMQRPLIRQQRVDDEENNQPSAGDCASPVGQNPNNNNHLLAANHYGLIKSNSIRSNLF